MAFLTLEAAKNFLAIGGLSGHYTHPESQEFLESDVQADLDLIAAMIRGGLERCGYSEAVINPASDADRILTELARRLFRAAAYKRGSFAQIPLSVLDDERDARKQLDALDKLPGLVQSPIRQGISWGSAPAKFHHSKMRGF